MANIQGFGIQLATGGFSLEANTIFATYAEALAYAQSSAAYVGKVISVTSGENKGIYSIEVVGANAAFKKVGSDVDLSNYVTKDQITNLYTYKGSKATFAELPLVNEAGDTWNVEEAYNGHPAGTNYAWVADTTEGGHWDALAGSVDLSGYFTKDEVNSALTAVSVRVDDINLLLNGNDDDTDDIPNQIGIVSRLEAVEDLIGQPTDEDKTSTMLSRLTALESLVTGGGEEGEGDQTLLQKVNQNTLNITALETTVYGADKTSGLVKAVEVLNGAATVEGSVDYKIAQAFAWVEV